MLPFAIVATTHNLATDNMALKTGERNRIMAQGTSGASPTNATFFHIFGHISVMGRNATFAHIIVPI